MACPLLKKGYQTNLDIRLDPETRTIHPRQARQSTILTQSAPRATWRTTSVMTGVQRRSRERLTPL